MDSPDLHFSTEATCVLQYLNTFRGQFISEMEIARRAETRNRFAEEPRWALAALAQLLESSMIETDGHGRYRLKNSETPARPGPAKFIDPRLRAILERSGQNFDLSGFS